MHDLTRGSIPKQILVLAAPIAIGMIFQTLYYLVDLYFVATLGDTAIAGVSAGGNLQFVIIAMTQVLGVGSMALISHAVGQRDPDDANLVFNQSLGLAAVATITLLVVGLLAVDPYMQTLGADAETVRAGADYLYWYLPGMALQFALVVMGSALRGTGIAKPTMVVQMATVVLNAILSPILIVGWGTGVAMGVAGAGLASSISVAAGVALMTLYFKKADTFLGFARALARPKLAVWKRILKIGLPPGGEFFLLFVILGVIYWVIRGFGAEAQAGFGVGSRVMQAIFLPAMAIAFATAPVAGQNFGAGQADRVRATFRASTTLGSSIMVALTLLCQWRPAILVRFFTDDPEVIAVGAEFLQIISWNFLASGIIFTCSGMFQALGNTIPGVLSTASRLLTFVVPAIWMSTRPDFDLRSLWFLSVTSVGLQAVFSLLLYHSEAKRRLAGLVPLESEPENQPLGNG